MIDNQRDKQDKLLIDNTLKATKFITTIQAKMYLEKYCLQVLMEIKEDDL